MRARFQNASLYVSSSSSTCLAGLTIPPSSTSRAAVPGTSTTGSLVRGVGVAAPPMLPDRAGGASSSASIVPESSGWVECDMAG